VIALGRQGLGKAAIAADLGIDRSTLAEWQQRHPEMEEAMLFAATACEAWWDALARRAIQLPANALNASLYAQCRARLRHEGWWKPGDKTMRAKFRRNVLLGFSYRRLAHSRAGIRKDGLRPVEAAALT